MPDLMEQRFDELDALLLLNDEELKALKVVLLEVLFEAEDCVVPPLYGNPVEWDDEVLRERIDALKVKP